MPDRALIAPPALAAHIAALEAAIAAQRRWSAGAAQVSAALASAAFDVIAEAPMAPARVEYRAGAGPDAA